MRRIITIPRMEAKQKKTTVKMTVKPRMKTTKTTRRKKLKFKFRFSCKLYL